MIQKKSQLFFVIEKNIFSKMKKICFEKFQNSFSKKKSFGKFSQRKNIFAKGFFEKYFFIFEKYFFDDKKKVAIFLDHYIALKFYEEAIFRILRAIWQVWALQIF